MNYETARKIKHRVDDIEDTQQILIGYRNLMHKLELDKCNNCVFTFDNGILMYFRGEHFSSKDMFEIVRKSVNVLETRLSLMTKELGELRND